MLNPAPIADALASALASIPDLAAAMTVFDADGNPKCRISAYHYRLGAENTLSAAIFKMPAPSILVAWDGTQGGNFNASEMFKHKFQIYFKMGNAAGQTDPVGYEDLWWLASNGKPAGSPVGIRYMNLVKGLEIMDTPSVVHQVDADLIDIFVGTFVIPEIGDN